MLVRQCTAEVYSCSRAVLLTRAILGVLQVENNFDVSIITDHRYGCSVCTTREHGPWTRPVNTGRVHGCSVHTTRVHGPRRRAVFTPVNTARDHRYPKWHPC